jgi:hypothetical protein
MPIRAFLRHRWPAITIAVTAAAIGCYGRGEHRRGPSWTAVTIDSGDVAKTALDRITVPQDVLDRIAPTALPRSSLIISDEPLHRETNYRTEFVIALNDQPQGGIINRPRSPDVRVARRDDFGFGWGWLGFNNTPGRGGQYYDPRQNNRNYYQRSQRWF